MPPNKVTISLSGAHQYVEDGLSLTPFVTSIEEGDNSQKAIIAMNTPDFDGRIHYYINDNEIFTCDNGRGMDPRGIGKVLEMFKRDKVSNDNLSK